MPFHSRPLLWGILLALADLGLYARYLEAPPLYASLHVALTSITLFAAATALAFVLILGCRWATERIQSGVWKYLVALSHGALAGGCLLITVFSNGSQLDLLFLPPNKVLTSNFWVLAASAVLVALIWGATVFRRPHWEQASRMWLLAWLGAVAALFTYTSAHGPQTHLHALLVAALVGLAGWPVEHVKIERKVVTTLAVAVVLMGAGFVLESSAGNDVRLVVHERSRMTFQIAALSPASTPRFPECESVEFPKNKPVAEEDEELRNAHPQLVRGVVFIIVDTLRADVIGRHHRSSSIAPNMTRFLEKSVAYERAYTVHPRTAGAMKTLFGESFHSSTNRDLTLLDVFAKLPHYVVVASHAYLLRHIGNPRVVDISARDGHDIHRVLNVNIGPESAEASFRLTSDRVTDAALRQFEKLPRDQQFSLVVHYLDPHAPYAPNELVGLASSDQERYKVSVAHTDYWIGQLLEGLEAQGREDVAVVVISDHGEEFGDHGYYYHSHALYDESTRIVMGINLPSAAQGHSVEDLVALPSLGPTLAALLGVDVRKPQSHLLPPWGAPADIVPLQTPMKLGSVQGEWKVIFNKRTGVREMYHLEEDPGELRNVVDEHPELFESLICRAVDAFPKILKP